MPTPIHIWKIMFSQDQGRQTLSKKKQIPRSLKIKSFFDFSCCKIFAEVCPGPHLQCIGSFQISRLCQGLGKCSWNTFEKSIHYPETNGKHSLWQNFQLLRWSWNGTCCPGGGGTLWTTPGPLLDLNACHLGPAPRVAMIMRTSVLHH